MLTGERRPLSFYEQGLWAKFKQRFGLKTDRMVWAIANGAAVMANSWGSDVKNSEIVPRFGSRSEHNIVKLAHQLAGLSGAQVEFIPKDGGPVLSGQDALAVLDEYRSDGMRRKKKTLDEKTAPKGSRDSRSRSRTLAGD